MPTIKWAIREKQRKSIVQSYLACITFVDAQVGQVLEALDASAYRDNTIAILWSDHGYHLGEKTRFAKQALWDRASRVPLIIATPDRTANGTCNQPVGLIDLYPTLLEICGRPANKMNEGISLAPLLKDPNSHWFNPTVTTNGPGNRAVQTERYRYYQHEDRSTERYDHEQDPNEWHNFATKPEMQQVISKLKNPLPSLNAKSSRYNSYPTNPYFLDRFDGEPILT